ncbi:GNAT family N-acetyltransferase [Terribacillus sp. 7520-G]|uniref:GNAT family N-acetyltransferase n=1 Tax=Terribacillus TaxID=459532 RepID=UPI001E62E0EA|nr:GNAT family N-acetyltransferase [Terribacillus sp. 7520-G]
MIRTLTENDYKEVTRLTLQLGYPSKQEIIENRIRRLLNEKDNQVFVYEGDGCLLGWVHVFGKLLIELEYAEIGGLIVDQNYRQGGIGSKLMRKSEEWAKENGYKEIRLRSGGQRLIAHDFYKRIGYKNTNSQQLFVKSFK